MKKILSIIIIVFIILLYITTLILSILNIPGSDSLFKASIYATVVIPILVYIYLWIYKLLKKSD